MNKTAFIFALLAGTLWGIMGFFTKSLGALGFSSFEIACLRLTTAALTFIVYALIKDRESFKIKLREIPFLIFFGISGVTMTSITYFLSIKYSAMAISASLMYTAPAIVIIAFCILFGEKLNMKKVTALFAAFIGACLVSGIMNEDNNATLLGVVFGLLSGLFYASYSIIGTVALKKHSSVKATLWAFIFAALFSMIFANVPSLASKLIVCENIGKVIALVLGIGIFSTFFPFILYTASLERTKASKAVLVASVEPLVAALTGFAVFGETLTVYSAIGILLILTSVVLTTKKD